MAIVYVGGQTAGRANPSSALSVNFALTGGVGAVPRAGDLVVVCAVTGSAGGNPAMAVATPTGYTALGQLNQSAVASDTSLDVSYKRMGNTPDTAVTIPGTADNAAAEAYSIQVFRGVSPVTPMDAAAVSAGGTATGRPDPASITPVTAGAWVVVCGGGAAGTGANYTAPANYTTNFLTSSGADTTDAMVGAGYRSDWSSGAENPAAFTGGTTGATDSWACYTLALRPDTAAPLPTLAQFPGTRLSQPNSLHTATSVGAWAAQQQTSVAVVDVARGALFVRVELPRNVIDTSRGMPSQLRAVVVASPPPGAQVWTWAPKPRQIQPETSQGAFAAQQQTSAAIVDVARGALQVRVERPRIGVETSQGMPVQLRPVTVAAPPPGAQVWTRPASIRQVFPDTSQGAFAAQQVVVAAVVDVPREPFYVRVEIPRNVVDTSRGMPVELRPVVAVALPPGAQVWVGRQIRLPAPLDTSRSAWAAQYQTAAAVVDIGRGALFVRFDRPRNVVDTSRGMPSQLRAVSSVGTAAAGAGDSSAATGTHAASATAAATAGDSSIAAAVKAVNGTAAASAGAAERSSGAHAAAATASESAGAQARTAASATTRVGTTAANAGDSSQATASAARPASARAVAGGQAVESESNAHVGAAAGSAGARAAAAATSSTRVATAAASAGATAQASESSARVGTGAAKAGDGSAASASKAAVATAQAGAGASESAAGSNTAAGSSAARAGAMAAASGASARPARAAATAGDSSVAASARNVAGSAVASAGGKAAAQAIKGGLATPATAAGAEATAVASLHVGAGATQATAGAQAQAADSTARDGSSAANAGAKARAQGTSEGHALGYAASDSGAIATGSGQHDGTGAGTARAGAQASSSGVKSVSGQSAASGDGEAVAQGTKATLGAAAAVAGDSTRATGAHGVGGTAAAVAGAQAAAVGSSQIIVGASGSAAARAGDSSAAVGVKAASGSARAGAGGGAAAVASEIAKAGVARVVAGAQAAARCARESIAAATAAAGAQAITGGSRDRDGSAEACAGGRARADGFTGVRPSFAASVCIDAFLVYQCDVDAQQPASVEIDASVLECSDE